MWSEPTASVNLGQYASLEQGALVCWSRMQAEAGQRLYEIVKRKEAERRAGDGVFFWGVGNAPAKAISVLARAEREVEAVFSVMLGKPKPADASPESVVVWRRYVDLHGMVRELPDHVVVTSRGGGGRQCHYALMCQSDRALVLDDLGPFDPGLYRNASKAGGVVGASQITALLVRNARVGCDEGRYRVNLRAFLRGSYWVKLVEPVTLSAEDGAALASAGTVTRTATWLRLAERLRQGSGRSPKRPMQRELFI